MLKIKDNVDLKELEKYGFKIDHGYDWQNAIIYTYKTEDYYIRIDSEDYILIYHQFGDGGIELYVPDIIYDLIKEGLVEKVK